MAVTKTYIPKKDHDAVVRWQETYLPDYDFLVENWDKYFPKDQQFELCAFRELGMCNEIECGALKGQDKFTQARDMEIDLGSALVERPDTLFKEISESSAPPTEHSPSGEQVLVSVEGNDWNQR